MAGPLSLARGQADFGWRGEGFGVGQLTLHAGTSGTLATVGKDAWNPRFVVPYAPDLCAPIDLNL